MGLTKFGLFIRKFRLDHSMILKKMDEDLGISSAYLSGIETGTRPIPGDLDERIIKQYELSDEQASELKKAVMLSRSQVSVNTGGDLLNTEILNAFSRSIDTLSKEQKECILKIIKGDVIGKK